MIVIVFINNNYNNNTENETKHGYKEDTQVARTVIFNYFSLPFFNCNSEFMIQFDIFYFSKVQFTSKLIEGNQVIDEPRADCINIYNWKSNSA